jgi:histidyl-tRNA synthetase
MIKAITGTKDILPSEIPNWNNLEDVVRNAMKAFNYKEIRTPIFEETRLFSRGIGEATDIVGKEMYTFLDRSETSITLKPEMTASVVRALLEHSLDKQFQLNKLFYISPMFRQERPQAGRFRQFNQFGVEALGSTSPSLDAEMILLAYQILKGLGLSNFVVKINSLGVPESRENYKNLLKEYLADKLSDLSEESQKRYETNILRLFDSKDKRDKEIMEHAPLLIEHLDDESLEHFEEVKQMLLSVGVPFEVDPKLVRGLDYYTGSIFEVVTNETEMGSICGGGRYDDLTGFFGLKNVSGIGISFGADRLYDILLTLERFPDFAANGTQLLFINFGESEGDYCEGLVTQCRRSGINTELYPSDVKMQKQMKYANTKEIQWVAMIGENEMKNGLIRLKNMESGDQQDVLIDDLIKLVSLH